MGEEVEAAIPAITSLFRSGDCDVADSLTAVAGKAAVPVFIEELEDENESIRTGAATGLGEIGEEARDAVPALIEALNQEGSTNFKDAVVEALGKIGTDADLVVPVMIDLYEEIDSRTAVEALASYGPDARDAIPQIEQAFVDPQTRSAASEALGSIGRDAVPTLVSFLNDSDPEVRASAAYGLMLVGEDAADAVDDLKLAIEDQNQIVRSASAVALAQIDPTYADIVLPELILHLLMILMV